MPEPGFEYGNNERIACPECGNDTDIINDVNRGEIICGNCGIV
ncbi:MAG: TFIIB-type zinc ribbon-containing protein, partial [Promethearchaeota archaeon]